MFRKLTLVCALVALLVIVLGTYVRLSDAGLGCPDWPGCYGKAIVTDSAQFKVDSEALFPSNPLDIGKAWKEMTHRYLAGTLGILVLVLLPLAWFLKEKRSSSITWTIILLVLVASQAALGMWTVDLKVMPLMVTLHLLLGFITFWAISWTYLLNGAETSLRPVKSGPLLFSWFGILLLFLQIASGGWVSSHYAALACTDFPHCQGELLPITGLAEAFDVLVQDGTLVSAAAKVTIHALHQLGALITFVVLSLLMLSATSDQYPRPVRRSGLWLSILLLVQIVLGILSVKN